MRLFQQTTSNFFFFPQSVAPSRSTSWIIRASSMRQQLTGIFTNTTSISTVERNMVRGTINCCRGKRERACERMRLVPPEWEWESHFAGGCYIIVGGVVGGLVAKSCSQQKNKEARLGHDNNLIFRVCNLMISSQKPAAAQSPLHLRGAGEHKLNSTIHFISKVIYWDTPLGNQARSFSRRERTQEGEDK